MTSPDGANGDAHAESREQWMLIRGLVEQYLACDPHARAAFLDASCGGDPALHARIERLASACERADGEWDFLARPAGELIAPLLASDESVRTGVGRTTVLPPAFHEALADRYVVGPELGHGGMATVYVAEDLRHQRRVALKILDPHLGAILGADRFLTEIRVTAGLKHPNLLPLFDSGEAGGLLYYVMPLIDGATLRARLQREGQFPVSEAVRITVAIAAALDYAHRQGVVHRDLKPENILLQDGEPLVADFGISLAVQSAGGSRLTATGMSLGTPQYMSPEQAAGGAVVDGRSDIYSLASVLYEMLVGDPPFTGRTAQSVIAKVLAEEASSVRVVRPAVPEHIDAALARALSKLPADRHSTAREFADALLHAPTATQAPPDAPVRRRDPLRLVLGALAVAGFASAVWMATRPPERARIPFRDLIDGSPGSSVTLTPDGRMLVYTGAALAGRPIMMQGLDEATGHSIPGTEGAHGFSVSPSGKRLAFFSTKDNQLRTVPIGGGGTRLAAKGWRYGNGAWIGDSAIVVEDRAHSLVKLPAGGTGMVAISARNVDSGEMRHAAPLVLPDERTVVFTVTKTAGGGLVSGVLAMASLDQRSATPSPHIVLGIPARRAFAFVDGRLLYTSVNGKAIMAVPLDINARRTTGPPIQVLEDDGGDLETAALADNGRLQYLRRPRANAAVLVDTAGAIHSRLANPEGPFMYPRISPDRRTLAVQVTSAGGQDLFLYDIASGTPTRLTTTGTALHPTWTPDGTRIVYVIAGARGLMSQPVHGGGAAERIGGTEAAFGPEVSSDGKTVVFQRKTLKGWNIFSASMTDGLPARPLRRDTAVNLMPSLSHNGRWLAYSSNTSGRYEVYVQPFPGEGPAVQVSDSGGIEPAWSAHDEHIYYRLKGVLMTAKVQLPARASSAAPSLAITSRRQYVPVAFDVGMPHRNYDQMPAGSSFFMIAPSVDGILEVIVKLNWLTDLRDSLALVH